MRALKTYAACLALTLALAGCSESEKDPVSTESTTGASSPTEDSSTNADSAILDWQSVESVDGDITQGSVWSLAAGSDASAILTGEGEGRILGFEKKWEISDLLLDEDFAVVVLKDPTESAPSEASVIALNSDGSFTIDANSALPTTTGGTWSLGEGKLFYATDQPKNAYCLAALDLATKASEVAWCAANDEGFNDARITPAGLTLLTFKLGKDGCRTPVTIDNGQANPIDGIKECAGWDSLITPAGTIWSEIPDGSRVEEATFFANTGAATVELGPGDSGSLTWCGTAAYFTQQPVKDGDPATLLRWRDGALDIVYETPGSPGFISKPRCGGTQLTITAQSEGGDEQLTAAVD